MPGSEWKRRINQRALLISLVFLVAAGLWIWFSDQVVDKLALSAEGSLKLQTLKGILFVVATSLLLFVLVRRGLVSLVRSQEASMVKMATQFEQIRLQTTALESAAFAVVITDRDGVIQWVNPFFTQLTGYSRSEAIGQTPRLLNSGLMSRSTYTELWRTLLSGSPWRGQLHNRRKNGSVYTEEQTITPVRDAAGTITHFVSVKQDVTERNRHIEQLQFLTTHDPLTGLANRQLLTSRLDDLMARGVSATLVSLDLDAFQLVNETTGHEGGDRVLQEVACSLQEVAPPEATVARMGDDDFALLLPGRGLAEGERLLQRLQALLEAGKSPAGAESVSFSAGIVPVTPSVDPKEALLVAQLVLRQAREMGRGQIRLLVSWEELESLQSTARWGKRLTEAIRNGTLKLYYQPVVHLKSGRVVHAEALLRLVDESGSIQPAQSFLQAAEQFRLMPEIDRWILARVLEDLERWTDLRLFMNLSGQSLRDPNQLRWIATRLQAAGAVTQRLTFEITETVAVGNLEQLHSWMQEMHGLGCHFALDDLGQGFSSLSYLTNLPVSYVKIDGSFIVGIDRKPKNRLVVEALTRIARSMGLRVVAEWVEDEATVQVLQEVGVEMGQGFFLGRPTPLPELVERFAPRAG